MSIAQLQQAISHIKSGQRAQARALLVRILEQDPTNDMAWLALVSCLDEPAQKRLCLEKALAINPENHQARQALEHLVQPQAPGAFEVLISHSLLEQAQAAEVEGRFSDAYKAYSQVLEGDLACIPAWIGKGLAAGLLSTPQSIRVNEAARCFRSALQANQAADPPSNKLADLQDRVSSHELRIAAHLNRLSAGVDVTPKAAARLAYAALFVLGHVYSAGQKEESRSQLLEPLRSQVQRIVDYEQRVWESRNVDLLQRPDLIQHIRHSILSSLPADLAGHPSFQSLLGRFFKPLPLKAVQPLPVVAPLHSHPPSFFLRFGRYVSGRFVVVAATLCVGVYIAILVANLGGYVDNIRRAGIDDALNAMGRAGFFKDVPPEDMPRIFEETRHQMEEAAGLLQPFLVRNVRWTVDALAFRWSNEQIWKALPNTLLLFGVAAVIIFIASLLVSLALSLRYGSWLDRLMVALSPLSSAPSWVHGILLIVIFAIWLDVLPFGGKYDIEIPGDHLGYALMIARHLVLPVTAIFLSMFFQLVYTWRTFFLIHSGEDYVEVARAKGLPSHQIEQRYILRPTLPFIITNYSLMVLGFWQSAIALELFFDWPGIGRLYLDSITMRAYQQGMVVSLVTIFAYLLAISFFLLDMVYALVDPRVSSGNVTSASEVGRRPRLPWRKWSLPRLAWGYPRLAPAPGVPFRTRLVLWWAGLKDSLHNGAAAAWHAWLDLRRYPSAIVGLVVIGVMLGVSLVAVLALPYDEVVRYWNYAEVNDLPKNALPVWTNLFRREKQPETIVQTSLDSVVDRQLQDLGQGMKQITITYRFDYPYDGFPQEIALYVNARYAEKRPHLILTWIRPDGKEQEVASYSTTSENTYMFSLDQKLQRHLKNERPQQALFINPAYAADKAQRGEYRLRLSAMMFEPDADVYARLVVFGQVHGLAGTDHRRRDLLPALLWGAPAGLGVGFVGALLTTLAAMLLAAFGAWFGGWVDGLVQRLSEINLTLPMLPIGIMVYYLYSKNIWVILLAIVVFTMLGSPIKNYRAAFLQARQAPYIEAAQAYGAGNWRIIKTYLVPRIIPVLVPQLVATIPGFIFLEATLAILGVYDLYLPTWGKIIYDALTKGAFQGYYYWILEPLVLLLVTGTAFALVGFALDRIFNPRLRTL